MERTPTSRQQNWSGGLGNSGRIITALVLCVVVMVVIFGYVAATAGHDKTYVKTSTEQRVLALDIAKHASEAIRAKVASFALLQDARDELDTSVLTLTNGDEKTGLPASPKSVSAEMAAVAELWPRARDNIDILLKGEGVLRLMNQFVVALNELMPDLQRHSDSVANHLIKAGARPAEIYMAALQLMLSQRIATSVNRVMQGDIAAASAAAAFKEDTEEYSENLKALLNGNAQKGISRISDKDARTELEALAPVFESVHEMVTRILEKSPELFKAQNATNALLVQVDVLLQKVTALSGGYANMEKGRSRLLYAGYAAALAAFVLLIYLGRRLMQDAEERVQEKERINQRTQDAILRLLNEIEPIAVGDLTVHATVGEEITGSIADAINYALESLRKLVHVVNQMSEQVATTAEETQATAIHLARASDQQARQIGTVTSAAQEMARAIDIVSKNARQSASVARESVTTASDGVTSVQNVIRNMGVTRGHIMDTSSRIKRLGERSQEIGDVVELISGIAEQTNILALNAAIQAANAGEAGLGFTTVADEVQQLAERVGSATKRIESLVKSIQLDTAKAVDSMEASSSDVQQNAATAESAGDALLRIETVSKQLAALISDISVAATELAATAGQVSGAMTTIKNVTNQNLAGAKQTAALTGKLATLAQEQSERVSGFKLPQPSAENQALENYWV